MDTDLASVINYLGNAMLAYCALPSALLALRTRSDLGIPGVLLWPWFLGECFALIGSLMTFGVFWPHVINYGVNILCLWIILGFKLRKEFRND